MALGVGSGTYGYTDGAIMEFATEASSWDTGTHAWKSTAPVLRDSSGNPLRWKAAGRNYDRVNNPLYGYGTTEGDFLFCGANLIGNSTHQAMQVSLLDPLESSPTRTARERLFVSGLKYDADGNSYSSERGIREYYDLGIGSVFSQNKFTTLVAYMISWYGASADYFFQSLNPNCRTQKRDAISFMVLQDPDNSNSLFALNGTVPVANFFLASVYELAALTTFDQNQAFHFSDSMVIPWSGAGLP